MNAAMEMLRAHAKAMHDLIVQDNAMELIIDPIEEPVHTAKQYAEGHYPIESTTATVTKRCNVQLSEAMNTATNFPMKSCFEQLNLLTKVQSKLKVWIYNISHQERTLNNALIGNLAVPACPDDAEYAVVTSLPSVVIQPKPNVDTGETEYFLIDGRRLAMDLINPSNLGIDLDVNCDWLSRTSAIGNDFSRKGLFFSTHNPPLKKELKAAHKRLRTYYTDLVDRANIVRITSAAGVLGVPTSEISSAVEYVDGKHSTK